MSDLQCPARFLLLSEPDRALAATLRHERVAAVYAGPASPPGPPGKALGDAPGDALGGDALGDVLGLPVQVMTRRLAQADVLSQDPDTLGELRDLADLHRGETVVVVAEGEPGQWVDVSVDGDGVSVREVSRGASR